MPMRTAPERLLVRLEWRVIRRLDGRLAGGYRTAHRGTGTDLVGLREYTEGDDARHIDWNVTARLNEPQLRVFTEDRELTVWLVLDRSASMAVGAPGRGKDDVLSELALVLARLFGRGGNRVGALLYDTGAVRTVPPGTGRRHALRIGAELARTAAAGTASGRRGSTTDLAAMLDAVAKLARRRALIVVISDFIGDGDWGRSLLRLVPRHEVVALRVVDAADDELPDVGLGGGGRSGAGRRAPSRPRPARGRVVHHRRRRRARDRRRGPGGVRPGVPRRRHRHPRHGRLGQHDRHRRDAQPSRRREKGGP